jgi:hypothetical protein
MRPIVGTLVAAVVTAAGVAAQGSPATKLDAATEALLVRNEHALIDAVAKGDKAAYQTLVLPEGIWTTPSGFVPMGPMADGLQGFQLPKWGIENPRVVWTDGNSALLLYTRSGGGRYDLWQFTPRTLASTLWTKRGGTWVAVHHQESALTQ